MRLEDLIGDFAEEMKKVVKFCLEEEQKGNKPEASKYYKRGTSDLKTYPYREGDGWALGPETFTDANKKIICHQGQNYYKYNEDPRSISFAEEARAQRVDDVSSQIRAVTLTLRETARHNKLLEPLLLPLVTRLKEALLKLETS